LIFIDYLNVLSGRKKGVFSTYIFWSIRVNNYLYICILIDRVPIKCNEHYE
jgi:hypothetical protein